MLCAIDADGRAPLSSGCNGDSGGPLYTGPGDRAADPRRRQLRRPALRRRPPAVGVRRGRATVVVLRPHRRSRCRRRRGEVRRAPSGRLRCSGRPSAASRRPTGGRTGRARRLQGRGKRPPTRPQARPRPPDRLPVEGTTRAARRWRRLIQSRPALTDSMPRVADDRITRGMEAQLAEARRTLDRDERPLGWKLGFGTEAAMQKLGIDAPLVGYLPTANRLESGAVVDISSWGNRELEPEIVARAGEKGEITAIGAAIELVDLDPSVGDPEAILERNIFQRHVLLGPVTEGASPRRREARRDRRRRGGRGQRRRHRGDRRARRARQARRQDAEGRRRGARARRHGDRGSIVPALSSRPATVEVRLAPLGSLDRDLAEVRLAGPRSGRTRTGRVRRPVLRRFPCAARVNERESAPSVVGAALRSVTSGMSRANSHGLSVARRRTASSRRCVAAVRFATTRTRVRWAGSIGCSLVG